MEDPILGKGEKTVSPIDSKGKSKFKRSLSYWIGIPIALFLIPYAWQALSDMTAVAHWMGRTGLYIQILEDIALVIGVPLLFFWGIRKSEKKRKSEGKKLGLASGAGIVCTIIFVMLVVFSSLDDGIKVCQDLSNAPVTKEVLYSGIKTEHERRSVFNRAMFYDMESDQFYRIPYPYLMEGARQFGAMKDLGDIDLVSIAIYPRSETVVSIVHHDETPKHKRSWSLEKDIDGDMEAKNASVEGPQLLSHVEPIYPEKAQKAGITGTVIVGLIIDMEGNVPDAWIISSSENEELDRSAVLAVRQWRFRPAQQDGKPVEVESRVPVSFALH